MIEMQKIKIAGILGKDFGYLFVVIRFGQRGFPWLFPAHFPVPASRSGYIPDDCLFAPDNRGGRLRRRGTAMLCRYQEWKWVSSFPHRHTGAGWDADRHGYRVL